MQELPPNQDWVATPILVFHLVINTLYGVEQNSRY